MPLRRLTARTRTPAANWRLAATSFFCSACSASAWVSRTPSSPRSPAPSSAPPASPAWSPTSASSSAKPSSWNRDPRLDPVRAAPRLALLFMLVALFFSGGATGAFLYPRVGFNLMLPLALLLAVPTLLPIAADLHPTPHPNPL